jgi:undecaprenyl diphosphate synthase
VTELDLSALDPGLVPAHVGLILDGNGRWANQRGLHRTEGHRAGEETLFDCIRGAIDIGIGWLTAFTFSTENWARDPDEVAFLMWFNEDLLVRRRDVLHEWNVRIFFAGDLADARVPERNRLRMRESEELTRSNTGMSMVFAFNYGSRWELTEATRSIARRVAAGELDPEQIDEGTIAEHLAVPEMPDLDLLIRSSGERRLSNFLLWQAAYAELAFPGILWPDFDRHRLLEAVLEYQRRDRRFGGAIDMSEMTDDNDR